jgi:sialic acid synthase SpsE
MKKQRKIRKVEKKNFEKKKKKKGEKLGKKNVLCVRNSISLAPFR